MTCHDALALLEGYVDGELSPDKETRVKTHLSGCSACRGEFETSVILKELLKQTIPPDPGEEYWSETTRLIKARTTESRFPETEVISVSDRRSTERSAFARSLVSVAASLVVLFSALLLGSGTQERIARLTASEPPVYVATPLEQVVGSDNTVIVTQDENFRLARGMLLLGAPGSLGRFISPFAVMSSAN